MSIPFPKNMESPRVLFAHSGPFSRCAPGARGCRRSSSQCQQLISGGTQPLSSLAQALIWGWGRGLRQEGYGRREEALADLIHLHGWGMPTSPFSPSDKSIPSPLGGSPQGPQQLRAHARLQKSPGLARWRSGRGGRAHSARLT